MEAADEYQPWKFPIEHRDHAFVLIVSRELLTKIDEAGSRADFLLQMQQELESLINETDHPHIVVSFEDARFVTSGVLGMMVQVHQWAEKKDGRLHLAGLDPQVSKVFTLTRLDKLLHVYTSVDDALAAFDQNDQ